jgi:hypothetical protein
MHILASTFIYTIITWMEYLNSPENYEIKGKNKILDLKYSKLMK